METKPRILKWALIIGIVIVLNLFLNYAISLFYKAPEYNNYIAQPQVVEQIVTKEACLKIGGQWSENIQDYNGIKNAPTVPVKVQGYCDPNFTKQKLYEEASKTYNRNIFIILVVLGAISLLLGAFMGNEIISLGLSWGGVLSLLIASLRYWSNADNWAKVLILGIALSALIWLAVKKFSNNSVDKSNKI